VTGQPWSNMPAFSTKHFPFTMSNLCHLKQFSGTVRVMLTLEAYLSNIHYSEQNSHFKILIWCHLGKGNSRDHIWRPLFNHGIWWPSLLFYVVYFFSIFFFRSKLNRKYLVTSHFAKFYISVITSKSIFSKQM